MSFNESIESSDFKIAIKNRFTLPTLSIDKPSYYIEPLSKNYGKISSAYSYMLRFYLEHLNQNKTSSHKWKAEKFALSLDSVDNLKMYSGKALRVIDEAKQNLMIFIKSGIVTDHLVHSALKLGHLDMVMKNGLWPEFIGETPYAIEIKDLKQLIVATPEASFFKARRECFLNPMVSKNSDADYIIDDMLVDIRTTKDFSMKPSYFYDLMGYLALCTINGVNYGQANTDIKKLGIYYPRQGHLEVINLNKLASSQVFEDFYEWFEEKNVKDTPLKIQ